MPRIAPPLLLLALLALIAAGCSGDGTGDSGSTGQSAEATEAASDSTETSDKPKKKEKAIKVDAAEVRRGELVIPIYADGTIRTAREVEVRTKIAGELIRIRVRDGDHVRAGQLLASIDQRQYEIDLKENRYRHIQALSRIAADDDSFAVNVEALTRFTNSRDSLEAEWRAGRLGPEEYRLHLLEVELAALKAGAFRQELFEERTGLAEARTAKDRAQLNLDNSEIRAPFAGVVHGLNVAPGEIVSVGTPICTILNNDHLEATVNVLEADLGNLEKDRPVLLAVPATGDTLQAKVDVISPRLDDTSRTCAVLIRFDNPDGRYRPGMFVRAEIAGWIHTDKLMVPKAALLSRDNRTLVFKVNDDRAQWLYVDTGLRNSSWVEILAVHSGGSLAPGEHVVVSDHLTLAHEAKIQLRRTRLTVDRWDFANLIAEQTR